MKYIYIVSLLIVCVFAVHVPAQQIVIGNEFRIASAALNEERSFSVSTPEEYSASPNVSYPVLYVLDGDEYFWMATSAVRYLANRGFMPQTIVVGIDNGNHRDRDLTPSKDQYSPNGGGAEKFLKFLNDELRPKIRSSYRTQPHETIFGASLGGLFSLWTLYNHPDSFDNYLAVSPSLFHDDGLVFKQSVEFFEKRRPKQKFVFLSLADEAWTEMRVAFNNTLKLYKAKAADANVRWAYRNYDNETHESTKLVGLNDALRELHEFWFVPFYQRDRGIAGLKDHFGMLTKVYRYKIGIPEELVARIANNNLREKKIEAAKSLFQYNVETFPNSPEVHYAMGRFFESQDEIDKAERPYLLAIETAGKQSLDSKKYSEALARIRRQLNK